MFQQIKNQSVFTISNYIKYEVISILFGTDVSLKKLHGSKDVFLQKRADFF